MIDWPADILVEVHAVQLNCAEQSFGNLHFTLLWKGCISILLIHTSLADMAGVTSFPLPEQRCLMVLCLEN